MTNTSVSDDNSSSQALLTLIAIEYMRQQKRKRFWQWARRIIIILLVLWGLYQFISMRAEDAVTRANPHIGLIDLKGGIFDAQVANADNFMKGMDKAYDNNKALKALILRIDSPGGSPVQADYMFNAIRYYREKYPEVKIYAVCVDLCASAAYYVASAADEIYANPSSLVGSIGVVYNGFGFVDTMQKLGVTRRLQTAGKNKGFMDQFSPVNPAQEKTLQTMLDLIHKRFIDQVILGRGKRLHITDETFSGLFWTGTQAKEMGLIDGFASSGQLARNIIKIDKVVDYTYQQTLLERVAKNIGTAMADQLPLALGIKQGIQ